MKYLKKFEDEELKDLSDIKKLVERSIALNDELAEISNELAVMCGYETWEQLWEYWDGFDVHWSKGEKPPLSSDIMRLFDNSSEVSRSKKLKKFLNSFKNA